MTRMWMVPPGEMCDQHLLGEHKEIHQLFGIIRAGHSIDGYLEKNLVWPAVADSRHRDLVREMERRGMNHDSPLDLSGVDLGEVQNSDGVNIGQQAEALADRCGDCRQRMEVA